MNINGPGSNCPWEPRFRHEVLNFHGQSTAINAPNGCGKTSITRALLGMLGRDKTLIKDTHVRMAPRSFGYPTHIQIEFVKPDNQFSGQSDIFIGNGDQVNGETWVFGISGFRLGDKNDELDYYFYPGTLEDCPAAIKHGGKKISLLTPEDFDISRKEMKKFWWHPKQDEWLKFMGYHVSIKAMKKLSDFQKQGGADHNGVDLFQFKVPHGERLDEAFFYEVVAPEILSGTMDSLGQENDDEIEEVIYNTVTEVIATKKKAERKRKELEQLKKALSYVEQVAMYAGQSKTDQQLYQGQLKSIAEITIFLKSLAITTPFTGFPSQHVVEGIVGEVAKNIVVELGKTEIRILASGLSILLNEASKRIRERAERNNIRGRKVPKIVENTCDLLSSEVGQKPISYTAEQAHQIIDISSTFADGIDRHSAHKSLDDAFEWFFREGDGNPYRKEIKEIERLQLSIQKDLVSLNEEIESLNEQEDVLNCSQRQMSANEGAYDKLRVSGQFSAAELSKPTLTAKAVKEALVSSQYSLEEFNNQKALLSAWIGDWSKFKSEFGDDALPHEVEVTKLDELESHKKQVTRIKADLIQTNSDLQAANNRLHQIELKKSKVKSHLEIFDGLIPDMSHFTTMFGDQNPDTLESDLLDTKRNLEIRQAELNSDLTRLKESVELLEKFKKMFGESITPSEQLAILDDERNDLVESRQHSKLLLKSIDRRIIELNNEQVAAGDAANDAKQLIEKHNFEYNPLYKTIESLSLTKERKRHVLSALSSLLFSPVFDNLDTGAEVASLLADQNLPVPVVSYDALKSFCKYNHSNDSNDAKLIFIGVMTTAVKCLLDPEYLEREKEALAKEKDKFESDINAANERLAKIGTESSLLNIIREAEKAESDNSIQVLVNVENELVEVQQKLDELSPKVTKQAIQWVRSAQQIKSMGGMVEFDDLKVRTTALDQTQADEASTVSSLEQAKQKNETLLEELDETGQNIFPSELRGRIRNAKLYFDNNGPLFESTKREEKKKLKDQFSTASARNDFYNWFEGAQAYLDARDADEGKSIQDKLAEIHQYKRDAKEDIRNLNADMEISQANIPKIKEMIELVDSLTIEITSRFRKMARFTKDVESTPVELPANYRDALIESESIKTNHEGSYEAIRQSIMLVSDEVMAIDVSEKLTDLRRKQNALTSTESNLRDSVLLATNEEGLAVAEKEILSSIKGVDNADMAISLWHRLRDVCEQEDTELTTIETNERESRDTVSGRLNYFIQRGSSNLTMFRQLAKKNYGEMKANFVVDADIISEEASEKLILEIIRVLEEEEDARIRSQKNGIVIPNRKNHRKSIEDKIRLILYRRVFTNPSIYYEMEAIRKSGKHLIDDSLSNGEKSAMSLMWAIRIADFAVEKESKNKRSSIKRNKARSLSESILILDGLFSDLSATDLIKSSMAGIERTRGKFQLIGLIHDEHYDNDFSIFPNLLLGKLNHSLGDAGGWVSFDNKDKGTTSVGFAHLHVESAQGNNP